MSLLSVGRWVARVDPALRKLAAQRSDVSLWSAPTGVVPALELRGGGSERPEDALPLDAQASRAGSYRFDHRTLEVWIPETPGAADAALRALFATAFELQGGALLHAAAIALGGRALVALGVSGAGKSTLAQHCAAGGLEVLSDETVGVLADGTVWPTPFRSSARYVAAASPLPRELLVLAFLEKAREERVVPVGPEESATRLLRQIYPGPALGPPERLKRAAALGAIRPPVTFHLRDDPGVASFVRELLR